MHFGFVSGLCFRYSFVCCGAGGTPDFAGAGFETRVWHIWKPNMAFGALKVAFRPRKRHLYDVNHGI